MKLKIPSKKALDKVPCQGGGMNGDPTVNASGGQRETAIHVLDATIQIIQQVTEFVPLDMAKNVLKGLTSILILLQKNIRNKDDLAGLARRCDFICSTLAQATKEVSMDDIGDALSGALRTLKSSIDELQSKVVKALQRGRIRRFLGASLDEKYISGWTGELDGILTLFSAGVNIVTGIYSEQTYRILKHRDVPSLKPELPPAPPAMFFGRDDLFAEIKNALLCDEDVALIGPGGIGKSTIAKALINDEDVRKHYARRFFVSYDGMDPTTITLASFVNCIAGALGLPMHGAGIKQQMISNLASSPVFLVLDNAETFEDAANPDTTEQISSTVAEIANNCGVTVMLTSRTTCNARGAYWTQVEVPPLERPPARQYFRKIYNRDIGDDDVDRLLVILDFHPLSIHILAHAARENRWTGKELLDEWQTQQSKLLQTGHKKENLGFTIRLSLSSPSVNTLGENALKVLRIMTFFPQGINRNHATRLFSSIPNITSLLDTLCKVSLIYRSGAFFTTLAPIRLFILDAFSNVDLYLLEDVRHMYYDSVQALAASEYKDPHADLIISDHLNIEHLIAYDITHTPDNTCYAARTCYWFLWGLRYHKLRPTSLAPFISSLPEGSHDEQDMKARCLDALAELQFQLSNFSLSATTRLTTSVLFIAIGNHSMASNCISNAATSYNNQGYYARSRQLLEDLMCSPSWQHIDEEHRTEIYFTLDWSRMYTSHDSTDNLFLHSMDSSSRGLDSRVFNWAAEMYHGFCTPEDLERNLELLRSQCISSSDAWDRWVFFEAMAEATFLQRRYDTTMELLNQALDAVDGDFMLMLVVLSNQAAVASMQGNYEFARSRLQYSLDTLGVLANPSSSVFLDMRYVHGRNELYVKNYSEARHLLVATIADCDIQGNIRAKTRSTRALGEAQRLLGCRSDSDRSFEQTMELCGEAGVPPELLDICSPIFGLDDDEFPGWRTYLQSRAQAQTGQ